MSLLKRSTAQVEKVVGPPGGNVSQRVGADQKVTFKACFLGAVASIGGFMFGYVR